MYEIPSVCDCNLVDYDLLRLIRSSLEIAALESERRKLRSKVDMFQRQVKAIECSERYG